MALFISHISFATNLPNAEAEKNGDKQKATEKPSSQTNEIRNLRVLPCTQTATTNASHTFLACDGTTEIKVTSSVTCSASGNSCDEALFAALTCSYQTAWTNVLSQEPVCPPVE